MPRAIQSTLLSIRDLLVSAGPFILLAIALLALTYWWLDPTPPRRVTLATGPAQSAYDEFGKRYAKALAANGITVHLVETEGSAHNLRLLHEGSVDLAFVQGGTADATLGPGAGAPSVDGSVVPNDTGLQSLGSLFVEPVWVFYQEAAVERLRKAAAATPPADEDGGTLSRPGQLAGLRVNVGTEGSGVPALMRQLFELNQIDVKTLRLSTLAQTPATVGFLGGDIDVLVFASAPESLMVQMLLRTPGVGLMDFVQSEAYSRRLPFLSPVVLPRGVVDLATDVPPRDVRLVASTTALLAREDTHPALLQLFAQAAIGLHGGAGWFNRAREFPNAVQAQYPLSREAERAMRDGPPVMQRYLPFWMANLVERMWLALGIIIAVLLPASRIVPPLYQLRIRSRVFRWYAQLREIEGRFEREPGSAPELAGQLDTLERKVERINVPLSYADELYALRQNIGMVRSKLRG
ncbi:MAG: C4-dicarboxylate ABC transporter substrate-binding protein [Burkholderiaceae bacterium]|nr:C4-dicarboxylate ABC transporter substrate-binding protein [Burkholderiaceae bacterium]